MKRTWTSLGLCTALLLLAACSGDENAGGEGGKPGESRSSGRRSGPPGGGGPGGRGGGPAAAVPVEVASVARRSISAYIETNGTLEAENEVDVVARTSGPIVELSVEEGDRVSRGRLLARLEQDELRSQLEINRVRLDETRLAYERAQTLQKDELISAEEYEQARAAFESARAQLQGTEILLGYTEIRAPFDGLIITRYVDASQHVSANTPLVRISDFTPLLCPIRVPERELSKLRLGQSAHLTVEAFPEERFEAAVLRISPVVDAATGTIKVTLEVAGQGRLRPGMFARVFLETDVRPDALVVPRTALSLESIGDTVYVVENDAASRREVELGFDQGDLVEVRSGVREGELVVVVGQDGLSNGTPLSILRRDDAPVASSPPVQQAETASGATPGPPGGRGGRPDLANMTPEQLERVKERMRSRGMSEEQIAERLKSARERGASGGSRP